jgi:hypothetical protein
MKKWILLLMVCVILAACSNDEKPDPTRTLPTATLAAPTLSVETRQSYEDGFEQLRQLHTQMDAVWGAISRGETAQCGTEYTTLSPEQFSEDHPIDRELRTAAVELADAVRLWQAECENPRTEIPANIIDRGLRMVLTAGDALSEVELSLADN